MLVGHLHRDWLGFIMSLVRTMELLVILRYSSVKGYFNGAK